MDGIMFIVIYRIESIQNFDIFEKPISAKIYYESIWMCVRLFCNKGQKETYQISIYSICFIASLLKMKDPRAICF